MEPIRILDPDFQNNWMAGLTRKEQSKDGHFYLVNMRRTEPNSWEENRLIVLVLDENGFPMHSKKIAFSYSTANRFNVDNSWQWTPPIPYRAHIVPTEGSGQIEHIQGSTVKEGQPGGVTVYVAEPEFSSDVVTGMGVLPGPGHIGVHLTFQLMRTGVLPLQEQINILNKRITALENATRKL